MEAQSRDREAEFPTPIRS